MRVAEALDPGEHCPLRHKALWVNVAHVDKERLGFIFLLTCKHSLLTHAHTHRWATQGFDFLQAIEPAFISALPEDDFLVRVYFV